MTKAICKRCSHEWDYKGLRTHWCSCPNCKTSVYIGYFFEKERSELEVREDNIKKLQDHIINLQSDFDNFKDLVNSKNPLLFKEWNEKKQKEVLKEVDDVLKGEKANGKKDN